MFTKSTAFVAALAIGTLAFLAPPASAADDGAKVKIKTTLSGAAEVPGPGDPDGSGKFKATIQGDTLCYKLKVKKIDPATGAHIHAGDAESTGPHVAMLETPTKHKATGCLTAVPDDEDTMDTLSESELGAIVADPSQFYVNVHNEEYMDGAVRGQLG